MPQHPQSPQPTASPAVPPVLKSHLILLENSGCFSIPSHPHTQTGGHGWRGRMRTRGSQTLAETTCTRGCQRMPQNPPSLPCPHDTHPNLWGTPLPLSTAPCRPPEPPPQLPWLRVGVNIPEISLGRGRAPAPPQAGIPGGVSPYLVCARGDPGAPRPWLQGTGCPRPCCSPGRRQRVLIEFLDYPGGEIVISLNPTSGRVP